MNSTRRVVPYGHATIVHGWLGTDHGTAIGGQRVVILTAPNFFCMPSDRKKAIAINERSAHAPKTLDQYKASHGAGCGCCTGKKKPARLMTKTKGGAKGFPTARPWMISH